MILRQYLHTDPVIAASYLFGCGGHAAGAVVDPVGEPERYLEGIGFERRFNRAFSITDEENFVGLMLRETPPRPARASEIRGKNLGLFVGVEA